MKNIQLSFNSIKEYAKFAFDSALVDDLAPLKKVKEYEEELKLINPSLREMFINDFAYELNTHQSKHFLKTGVLLSIDNSIPTIGSVWVMAWANAAIKNVKKLGIDKNFDFRKYPFKDTKYAIDKLSMIFEHVFTQNETDATKAYEMKDDVVPSYNFYKPTDQYVKNAFVDTIYRLASLQTFGTYLKEHEYVWDEIVECYYGKYKKENEDVFTSNVYGIKDKQKKEEKIKVVKDAKEQALSMRNEDYHYWNYFTSIEKNGTFLESLQKKMDLHQEKIVQNCYIKNNYDIMKTEIVLDLNKKLVKKTVKI